MFSCKNEDTAPFFLTNMKSGLGTLRWSGGIPPKSGDSEVEIGSFFVLRRSFPLVREPEPVPVPRPEKTGGFPLSSAEVNTGEVLC